MRALIGLSALLFLARFVSPAAAQEPQVGGLIETVNNPITEGVISQIKSRVDAARTNPRNNVKKVIFIFNPEGRDAATDAFGTSYTLAEYIRSLRNNGVQTIAFVNGKTTRHTVLPVIACDQVAMSSSAQIGAVQSSKDAPPDKTVQNAYLEMAGRIDRAGPVMRMFDPNVKLVQATYKGGPIYVDLRRLEAKDPAYAEVQAGNLIPITMPPGVGLYDVAHAIQYHVADVAANTLEEAREKYGLPLNAMIDDPLQGKAIRPVRIVLEGTIDTAMQEKVRRQVETAKGREENTFFFVIETTGGGDPAAARNLADFLIALGKTQEYPARTIAFVPGDAPDLAVFLAFACQELYMYKGPDPRSEAVIGDFSTIVGPPNQQRRNINAKFVHDNLAEVARQTGHSELLVDGMFESNLAIVRARNQQDGERRLMTEDDLKAQKDKGWVLESTVKHKGELLRLTASKAFDLRIAKTVDSKDVSAVYAQFGVEAKDVRAAEPSWLDNFAAFLRRPEVSILLVIIGIAGMVLEMKAPGLIIPGVVAAVCFILFFWAQTQLGGQLIYLAIMLFLLGLALIGIEIFLIPGFGVTGVCGILLVLAGLVLAGLDRAPETSGDWADLVKSMLTYGLTMAGAGVLAFILSRYLPKIPYANRLMLVPPEDRPEVEELPPLPGVEVAVSLLGQVGTATSMLRPAGTAKFGDRYADVVTEGDFIPLGTAIQVVEVEGTRIVVKRV